MSMWTTIKGWFGTAADDATGSAPVGVTDGVDTAGEVRDAVEYPNGGAEDASTGTSHDATPAAGEMVGDPAETAEDAAREDG